MAARTMIAMDQDEMMKTYQLLPVHAAILVGSKFVFTNCILLIVFAAAVLYQGILSQFMPVFAFSWCSQHICFAVSIVLTNLTLLGYYFLGGKNVQAIFLLSVMCVLFGIRHMDNVPAFSLSIFLPFIAIVISILFYAASCKRMIADVLGHTSFISGLLPNRREE
jgi:hypothetical protein